LYHELRYSFKATSQYLFIFLLSNVGDVIMETPNTMQSASRSQAFLQNSSFRASYRTTEYLTLVWAMLRAILFVWTGVHCTSMPIHAQVSNRPVFPIVMGNNIVGRVVEVNFPDEAMTGVQVHILEMGHTTTLDKKGYFTVTNVMNGKYTVQILAEGSNEILASQRILLRGHDVKIPTIAVERGEYVICGRVTLADNRTLGVANVRISLGNSFTTTDARGYYAFENLRYNASYTLKAETINGTAASANSTVVSANVASNTNISSNTSIGKAYVIYGAERTVTISGAITRQNFVVEQEDRETTLAQNMTDTAPIVEIGALQDHPK
jgi:hypothetical protein